MIKAEFNDSINDLITENLYQWDTYQTLTIKGINFGSVAPKVHFANKKSNEALVVQGAIKGDGSVEVSIPNTLLAEKYDILAYVYINTGLTNKTIKSITIPIIARLKPSEYYQPSNEDIAEIEAIELEAKAIIDGLYGSEWNISTEYKRPNIVYYRGSAYICNSNVGVKAVQPTNITYWSKIADGSIVNNINKDTNGNLVFTLSNGTEYTVNMAVKDVVLMDDTDIPAFSLTSDDVNKIKNIQETGFKFLAKTYNYSMKQNYSYLVLIPESSVADSSIRVYATSSDITQGTVLKKEIVLKPFIHLIKFTFKGTTLSINVDGEITTVGISTEYVSTNVVLYRKDDLTSLYDNFIVLGA